MRLTYKWLCDHLDTDKTPEELGDALTNLGLELEDLNSLATKYRDFSVCYVRKVTAHPESDHLKICEVVHTTKSGGACEVSQVVCGAPNVKTGMYGIFAPVGSFVPGTNLKLKSSKIRGVKSSGMLCSEREMEVSDDHNGIINVGEGFSVGTSFATWKGIDDVIYDIGVTPNRGDCLGVYGIARDLAAAGHGALKRPRFFDEEDIVGTCESDMVWAIESCAVDDVKRVVGRSFRGVTNVDAPQWMVERLRVAGTRSISGLVDISNYVMFDMGRPVHIYDCRKLAGNILSMRKSKKAEKFRCLHGDDHELDEGITVIADSKQVQGIAGIMGGEHSGCDEDTQNIFIEVACFTPSSAVRDGRATAIHTEARHRFERGVDKNSCDWGLHYTSHLIQSLCGGTASKVVEAGTGYTTSPKIYIQNTRFHQLTGIEMKVDAQQQALSNLGFVIENNNKNGFETCVPSWRFDITSDACLVEEIVRIYGVDNIPSVPVLDNKGFVQTAVDIVHRRSALAAGVLVERGLFETLSMSFCSKQVAQFFQQRIKDELHLLNPMTKDMAVMRPSVLATILPQLTDNILHQRHPLALFEVGPVYNGSTPTEQETVAAGIRSGKINKHRWNEKEQKVSVFTVKADALSLLESLGVSQRSLVLKKIPQKDSFLGQHYQDGYGAALFQGKQCLALFGMIKNDLCLHCDIEDSHVMAFEVFIDRIPKPKNQLATKTAWKRERLLPVERDFSFLLEDRITAGEVMRVVKKTAPETIRQIDVFDVFKGKGIKEGYKAVAISVLLQSKERSFTDSELSDICDKITTQVQEKLGGLLR